MNLQKKDLGGIVNFITSNFKIQNFNKPFVSVKL